METQFKNKNIIITKNQYIITGYVQGKELNDFSKKYPIKSDINTPQIVICKDGFLDANNTDGLCLNIDYSAFPEKEGTILSEGSFTFNAP